MRDNSVSFLHNHDLLLDFCTFGVYYESEDMCIICASSPYNLLETSCLSRSLAFITWGIDVERVGRFLILE